MSSSSSSSSSKNAKLPPNLPPGTVIIPVFSSLVRRDTERPNQCYVDVSYLDNQTSGSQSAEAIVFQNYYTSSISISMQVTSVSTTQYVSVLENKAIMPSPYHENGAQSWITVLFSEFNSNYVPGKPMRIYLTQPSPMWIKYAIKNVCLVSKPATQTTKREEATKEFMSGHDHNIWRKCSLKSIIGADMSVLVNKANTIKEIARKDEIYIEQLVKSAQEQQDKLNGAKHKKDKKKSSVKTSKAAAGAIGALSVGGVKKVKASTDPKEAEIENTVDIV